MPQDDRYPYPSAAPLRQHTEPSHHGQSGRPYRDTPAGWATPTPPPRKQRRVSGLAWSLVAAALVVGTMIGTAVGGGSSQPTAAGATATPATPGSCLRALDLADAGKATGGEYNHVANDCRAKAAGAAPAAGSGGEPVQPAPQHDAPEESVISDGTYIVGQDIQPGTYRTAGPASELVDNCYWARLKGTSGELGEIIANQNLAGPGVVTIAPSDGAFETMGCKPWVRR